VITVLLGNIYRVKINITILFEKTGNGYRYFFGVTTDGINGEWKTFLSNDED